MGTKSTTYNESNEMSYREFHVLSRHRSYIGAGISVILLVNGILVWEANIWAALVSFLIGATQLIISATILPRVNVQDKLQTAGNVLIQHSWLLVSVGLSTMAVYPSPFLTIPKIEFIIAMLTGLGWTILGIITIYQTNSKTEANLAV